MAPKYSANHISPIITFVSFLLLGVILGVYVNTNEKLILFYILGGALIGGIIAVLELRSFINKPPPQSIELRPLTKEERENQLARFVSDLFEEDIPFDEIEKEAKDDKEKINKVLEKHEDRMNKESSIDK